MILSQPSDINENKKPDSVSVHLPQVHFVLRNVETCTLHRCSKQLSHMGKKSFEWKICNIFSLEFRRKIYIRIPTNNWHEHNVWKNTGEHFPWYTNGSYATATFFWHFIVRCGWHWLSSTRWHRDSVSISAGVLSQRGRFFFLFIYFEFDTACVLYIWYYLCVCTGISRPYIWILYIFMREKNSSRHSEPTFWGNFFFCIYFTVGWQKYVKPQSSIEYHSSIENWKFA